MTKTGRIGILLSPSLQEDMPPIVEKTMIDCDFVEKVQEKGTEGSAQARFKGSIWQNT